MSTGELRKMDLPNEFAHGSEVERHFGWRRREIVRAESSNGCIEIPRP